ncbi:hypothetical protein [Lysinibacillus yapensis]|uniref:hypothetical protein n=1 Tax=Ureibacillus yapensis TaxID=2304605 RepID=UPI0011C3670C|nr:hypothetical protein [Lysinibacillus yapensis]
MSAPHPCAAEGPNREAFTAFDRGQMFFARKRSDSSRPRLDGLGGLRWTQKKTHPIGTPF